MYAFHAGTFSIMALHATHAERLSLVLFSAEIKFLHMTKKA